MELNSVSYHVGDGQWEQLTWDKQKRLFVSKDGTIRVAKPKTEDGKETTVKAQWGESEYAVTCTPGYDPTLCSIYDPSKGNGGRVEIRFGSTPPAVVAKPDAAAAAAAQSPAPPAAPQKPAQAVPSAAARTPPAAPLGSAETLNLSERRTKLAEWALTETHILEKDGAINLASKVSAQVMKDYGNKPITEKDLKPYYEAYVRREMSRAASAQRPVRNQSPRTAAAPARQASEGPLSPRDQKLKLVEWAKHETNIQDDDAINLADRVYVTVKRNHGRRPISERDLRAIYDGVVEKERRAQAAAAPKTRPNLGEHHEFDLGAPRGSAKAAATVPAADARAKKVRVAAEAKAAALEKRKAALAEKTVRQADAKRKAEAASQAAVNQKIQAAAAKAAERDHKLFEEANRVLERVTEIGKMPSAEVAKITADELSTLYRGIKDYKKGDTTYDAARLHLISLSKQKAQSIVDGLKLKQATVEMIAKEGPDSARKLWRAMAEFRNLYQAAHHDLKALEVLEPQSAHLKEIAGINTTINRVRPADIKGEEAKMRSELAKVTSALERIRNQMPKSAADSEKMAVLYKVADEMAKATENLDAFRKQHKDQLPKDVALIEGQRSNLAERLKGLQAPLIVEIRKYPGKMPQVENFDDPSQYGWITDESPSLDGKVRDLQVKYAKALIDAAQKLLGPDAKKWDDAVIVDPDSRNVEIWKQYWKTAHTAIHLVDEFKKTGKTPVLVPAAAPKDIRTPAEKVRDAAADAAKAAIAAKEKIAHDRFEPIRKNLQSQIDWVNGVHMKLLDDYGRPNLPVPPVKQLEEFETKLKAIQATLSTYDVDESGMSREDIHVTEELHSNAVLALGLIAKLLIYIAKAKTAPTEPARAVVGADVKPVPAPAISESDAQKTPDQFQEELGSKGLLIAGAETDPKKISEVEEHKKRVTQILEAARQRAKEPGMQEVIRAAESVLKRANSKIRELGGTVPDTPASRPTPPPVVVQPTSPPDDEVESMMSLDDARKQLSDSEMEFNKINQKLDTLPFGELAKLRSSLDEILVDSAWSKEQLNGKNLEYKKQADLARSFNKKVGALNDRVAAEITSRLDKRMASIVAIKNRAVAAASETDTKALASAKSDMDKELVPARQELGVVGELAKVSYWNMDDFTKRSAAIERADKEVKGTRIDKSNLDAKETAAANSALDTLRRNLDKIKAALKRNPDSKLLDSLDEQITKAIDELNTLKNGPVGARAEGILKGFTDTRAEIVKIRETQKTAKKYDEIRSQVTTLLARAEKLKDTTLDITALEANQKALEGIKSNLQAVNKDIPETDATRNLKNQISNGIIKIDGYIADLGNAISVKRAALAVPTEDVKPQISSLDQAEKAVAQIDKEYAAALKLTPHSAKVEKLRDLYDQAEAIRQKLLSVKGDITDAKLLAKFDIIYQHVNALTQNIYASKYQVENGLGVTLLPQLQSQDDYKSLKLSVDDGDYAITCDDLTEAQATEFAPKLASSIGMLSSKPIRLIQILTKGGASSDTIRSGLEREGLRNVLISNDPAPSKQPMVQLRFILDNAAAERVKKKYASIDAAAEHARSEAEKANLRKQAAEIEKKQATLTKSVSAMGSRLVEGHVQFMSDDKAMDLHLQAFRIPLKAPSNDLSDAAKAAFIEKQLAAIKPQLAQIRTLTGCTPPRPMLILSNQSNDDDALIPNAFEPKGDGKSKAKGSTRAYAMTRGQNGYIYVIVPAFDETTSVDGYYDGMSKRTPSFSALEALINQADHPGKGQPRVVTPPPQPETQPQLPKLEILPDASLDKPKGIFSLKIMKSTEVEFYLGIKGGKRIVYRGDVKLSALQSKDDKPAPAAIRLENVASEAKRLGHSRMLVLYRGKRFDDYKPIAESVAASTGIEITTRYSKMGSMADTGTAQLIYVVMKDSDNPDTILKAYEDNLSQEH